MENAGWCVSVKLEYDLRAIGARIKELRRSQNMTQEQAADRLDFGWNHYSHVESGMGKGSLDFYCKTAKLFGVSVDYLLFGAENDSMTQLQEIVQRNMAIMPPEQQALIADLVSSIMRNLNAAGEVDE